LKQQRKKEKMKACYIYLRVSTDTQATEGYSLDNQKRACREYAVSKGYHPKEIFVDDGKSGRTANRPEFQEMLKKLKSKKADCVIIYKIDRFARNITDFSRIRKEFIEAGIDFHSVIEGDLSNGSSLIANIFASVAEWESEVNGKRTRDALEQKFRGGWQPTPPPIGYRSVGGEKEKKTCEPDPYTAPIIKELFELYATGSYSLLELQEWLSQKDIVSKNGTTIGHSVINNILRSPFYYGLIRWKGQSKIGKHQPIIKKNLFDTCQYVLAKHRSFLIRKRKHNFLLRGFIFCDECGQRYTAEWHYNARKLKNRGGRIAYYHCPKYDRNGCTAPYVEMEEIERQIEDVFKTMQFSPKFINAVIAKTKEEISNSRQYLNSQRMQLLNKKTSLETKRNKLEDALLDETVEPEAYKRLHAKIQDKIYKINDRIQDLEDKNNIDVNLIEEVLSFTRHIYQTYKEAPAFLKRHYLRFFYDKIFIKNRKIVRTEPTPIFAILRENQGVIITKHQLPDLDSNQEPSDY
jgi:site-specific DNA recombinase